MNVNLTPEQNQFVLDNMALVGKVITDKFSGLYGIYSDTMDDLYCIGCLALCEAVPHYDSNKAKFSTYAYRCIMQAITTELIERNIISENEIRANTLFNSYIEEDENLGWVDAVASFSDGRVPQEDAPIDIADAIKKVLSDKNLSEGKKRYVRAFLRWYDGTPAEEAGVLEGASVGNGRNFVSRGRKVLSERREFRALWKETSTKKYAS